MIQELIQNKIPFIIGIGNLRMKHSNMFGKDFFITITEKDYEKNKSILKRNFHKENEKNVVTIELNNTDFEYFKDNIEIFEKKHQTKEGRIYQQIGTDFKKHYQKQNKCKKYAKKI